MGSCVPVAFLFEVLFSSPIAHSQNLQLIGRAGQCFTTHFYLADRRAVHFMPVSAPSSAVPVMPASSASRLHMTTTSFLAPVLIVKPSPLSQGNRYGYGYKNSNNGKRRRVTMVQNHNRNRNIPSSQDMMRPRMDPKVPPLGIPPPRRRRNVLPLASEVDFLLNHPVSELIVTNLVALSAIGFAVETVDLGHWNAVPLFLENAIASLFTAEYFLRWYGRNLSPRYLLSKLMLIDLVAILPLLLHSVDSTFLRLLRITRIFRLQRTMSDEWNDLFGDMTAAQIRLANVALTVLSIIYVSAGCFYEVERDVNPQILNFFDAFYYSTITLFTVGFGDIAPLTSLGRIGTYSMNPLHIYMCI